MTAADKAITTSFLISNLHCPSCVSTIKEVLFQCGSGSGSGSDTNQNSNPIRWVSPNVVTSVVTVEHDSVNSSAASALIKDMHRALEDSGFEVSGVTTTASLSDTDNGFSARDLGIGTKPTAESGSESSSSEGGNGPSQPCPIPGRQSSSPSASAFSRWVTGTTSRLNNLSQSQKEKARAEAHLLNCERCRTSKATGTNHVKEIKEKKEKEVVGPKASVLKVSEVNAAPNKMASTSTTKSLISTANTSVVDLGTSEQPPQPQPRTSKAKAQAKEREPDTWRATLSIGGMTCASCVNSITTELSKRDWIREVTVNLLTNSAAVEFVGDKADAEKLVTEIEDMGFDATLHSETVVPVHIPQDDADPDADPEEEEQEQQKRVVEILIKGIHPPPPSLEEQSKAIQRRHQLQILWRVLFSLVVAIPTFIIGIVYMTLVPSSNPSRHFLMKPWTSGISRAQIALFIMATPVYFFAADLFHRRAWKEVRMLWRKGSKVPLWQRFYRFGSMNTLMSLGTTVAYVSSVGQMIAAGARAAGHQEEGHMVMVEDSNFYFDSVVFLTFFLLLGRLIESYSKSRTGDAVEMLGKLRPTTAILVGQEGNDAAEKEGEDEVVQADLLDCGDVVRIPHGASPPADGIVVQGEGNMDESSLTGESKPVKKIVGDEVYTGTVNKDGPLLVRVTGVAGKSMLDEVVKAVREGQTRRAPIEQVADVLTAYFVPVVIAIAVATWIIWLAVGYSGHVSDDFLGETKGGWVVFALQFAISVFVVACPCGLALAAPTAIFVGGGIAAKHGILAKGGGEAFEKASRVDCVVFDKTGTLTMGGEPKITDSEVFSDAVDGNDIVLAALKAVEENSSHPIAKAIVAFCAAKTSAKAQVEELQEIAGKGMKARCLGVDSEEGFDLIVGNEALMEDFSVAISDQTAQALQRWKSEAKSVALVAIRRHQSSEWLLAVTLSISDPIRPEAPLIVKALQSRGTRVWMLSGDNPITAAAVAHQLGIPADQVIAGVLPTGKADKIRYLQGTEKARVGTNSESSTRRAMVAMVGDGINDSPALATADIGIAIGSGADIAISSADFVLINSDLRGVVTLLDLSSTVFRRIKFNFGWAVVYNCIALPVAAGAFYPIVSKGNHVKLDPVWAALAMALSSISVVLSSLALRSRVFGIGFRARKIGVEK
ncbi:E1-E2 ATPase-domain-containing protein [Sordaria brevicollis]|uniref:E1-E2 ATPase-domain-containing protein n=1 Tax=Sordaria brevicollis TaxID=83679 RepID=A0AAE0PL86_SORBR|nr:E1-E2 ATPase-domain-containing protein [Sordaria brevicollis]